MIEVKSNLSIPKLNQLYIELEEKKKIKDKVDLVLPKKFDRSEFGVLFSFLQFVATWVRSRNSGNLILPINGINEGKEYLEENEFVYPSIVLSWEKQILDSQRKNLRPNLKEASQKYFKRMEFFELKGRSVPIYCFDHDKRKSGLSKNLYDLNQNLVSEDALGINLYPAYKKIGSLNPKVFKKNIKTLMDDFSAIIYELFANTDEHAKTDEKGQHLYPNIRSFNLSFHTRKLETYLKVYNNFPGLIEYFKSKFSLNPDGNLYLIEISILDSGPGLVKRYNRITDLNKMSVENEVSIIKECLCRHRTSAEGVSQFTKGLGLDRVLKTIDGRGFVRIKSGRVDVYRNMKKLRYKPVDKSSDIALYDWQKNNAKEFLEYPVAEGTLISIFYPLEYK